MQELTQDQQNLKTLLDAAQAIALRGMKQMEASHPEMLVETAAAIRAGRGRLRFIVELDVALPAIVCQLVGTDGEGKDLCADLFRFGEQPGAIN